MASDGRDILIQNDHEWTAVASFFGWSVSKCQKPAPACYERWQTGFDCTLEEHSECQDYEAKTCEHSGSDGSVDCRQCGMKAGEFIANARQWMDDNDGAQAEDPGYFEQ